MRPRIAALLTALLVIGVLAGCGSSNSGSGSPATSTTRAGY